MGLHPGEGGSGVLETAPDAAPSAEPEAAPPPASPTPDAWAGLSDEEIAGFRALENRIGVTFRKQQLLREAMTHASWNNERGEPSGPGKDNERLEYLGDAVLELVVGEYLFRRFPTYDEGQLTQMRASLVNTVSLARLAERIGLGTTLLLGKGAAKTGARRLPSLLANAYEAMTGAIFLDHGFRVAAKVFLDNVGDLADWTDENHKGRLQEVAQERTGTTPSYRVSAQATGQRRSYTADAVVDGTVVGTGSGTTKQAAQQAAAQAALERMNRRPEPERRAAAAARVAAKGAASEPARVRRRVTEAAADRSGGAAAAKRGGGLLSVLRAAADALVGRPKPAPAPEPAKKKTRRGRRGGRGRGGGGGGSTS